MKLYHQKYGMLIYKRKAYKRMGNQVVDIYIDEKGKEHELDGTEIPYSEYLKGIRKKKNNDKLVKQLEQKEKDIQNLIKKQKEEAEGKTIDAMGNLGKEIRDSLSNFTKENAAAEKVKLLLDMEKVKGDKGEDGYTPVKGEDYFTDKEITNFKTEITPVKGKEYFTKSEQELFLKKVTPVKGKDYYTFKEKQEFLDKVTPLKGIDYYTDQEILEFRKELTPKKGVHYFDGKPGRDGKDGLKGDTGKKGDKPKHKWKGTKLLFEKPDGTWGKSVDLKGLMGQSGGAGHSYIGQIQTSASDGIPNFLDSKLDVDASLTKTESSGSDRKLTLGINLLDEDDMASDDATKAASQQSVKAYVDANIASGQELSTLLDVNLTSEGSPASIPDNDLLAYDSTTGKWINQSPSEAGFSTVAVSGDHADLSNIGTNTHAQIDTHLSDSDKHIAHSGVTLTAGTGLTGGGTIASNRTFAVDVGIADDKIVQIDDADVADNDFAKFTANGLEGRSYAEVRSDINVEDGATADQTGAEIKTAYEGESNTNAFTDAEKTLLGNQSGVNTGDQDLSSLALKSNVLELDNTDAFTPDADYEPATKKYVDDNAGGGGASQLSDLSDVGVTTATNRNALMADGDSWESRALVEADISDLGTYAATDQTMYIGTTQVAINRASAALTLAGITLTTPDIGTPSAGVLTNATGLPVSGLADGTDGELITWAADGTADTVAAGTADQVLTSNGAGAAPTFQDATGGGGDVGGEYGINVETLSGNKTLTPGTDDIYQYLNPGGANRTITIDTDDATAGDRFVIRNTDAYNDDAYLTILQDTDAFTVDKIYAGVVKSYIFDGTNWVSSENGSASAPYNNNIDGNIGIGRSAISHTVGTAIGKEARADSYGVAVGSGSNGYDYGVGIGLSSDGRHYGVAIGRSSNADTNGTALGYYAKTNSKHDGVALGRQSETERYAEIAHNIHGDDTDQENNITIGGWEGSTANNTPTEIFCGGTASQRFTVRASSVLSFKLQICARDNTSGDVAVYMVEDGVIKRDGAGNTTLSNCTVTTVHEDDATWDVAVAADDTNEALIITVTGDASNTVQWAARLDGVETHF